MRSWAATCRVPRSWNRNPNYGDLDGLLRILYDSAVVAAGVFVLVASQGGRFLKEITNRGRRDGKQISRCDSSYVTSHEHLPISAILSCPQSVLVQYLQCLRIKGVLPHPGYTDHSFQQSVQYQLYLGTGTHGTTQHYIALKPTHFCLSPPLHRALGSMPCGDMPSTMKKSQARDDAFSQTSSRPGRSAHSHHHDDPSFPRYSKGSSQLPKLNESQH